VVVNTTEAEDWSFGRGIAAVPKVSIQEESR
jgi:hypothetical protein